MSISINKVFGIHAEALQLHSQRTELLAANMANADTPHYKALDVDFKAALSRSNHMLVNLATTNRVHMNMGLGSGMSVQTQYRVPQQPALDGNTVDTQIEKSLFAENALRYQISLNFLNGKIKSVMNALRVEA